MSNELKLIISVIMDVIGLFSYIIPFIGEFTDIIFAPLQAIWIFIAYGTTKGAFLGGLEEILPGTDFIPSCTIIHFMNKKKNIYTDSKGYKRYTNSNKLVHRVVASNMVGGKICKGRVVHHIDGDKSNFRKNNLKIMSKSEHGKIHKK